MSHMSIIAIADDGKDNRKPDIWDHRGKFLGDVGDEDLLWDGQADVAVLDSEDGQTDDDDPIAEEVGWGLEARTMPGSCHKRGKEGYDQRVHSLAAALGD